jgi:hypothetical protein
MKILLLLTATLALSCAKDGQLSGVESAQNICSRPSITTVPSTKWLSEDEDRIPVFIAGCKRHYSKHHCPSKVLKTKQLSYQVTCKREK